MDDAKPELQLPAEYEGRILEVAMRLDDAVAYDTQLAVDLAEEELGLLIEAERLAGRRLHKGHPLHNLGVAHYASAPGPARLFFMAAHAEDIRLWPRRRPRDAPFLAEQMLRSLYGEMQSTLAVLGRLARRDIWRDPRQVAEEVVGRVPPPSMHTRTEAELSDEDLRRVPVERRIFVGGSYSSALDRIDIIETAVRGRGFEPVIVAQYRNRVIGRGRRERARPKSFRLLEMCSAAVFEGTARVEPGWWPELERIVQVRQIPALVAYFALHRTDDIHTSSMFPRKDDHPDLEIVPWGDHDHLRRVVEWWLDCRVLPGTGPMYHPFRVTTLAELQEKGAGFRGDAPAPPLSRRAADVTASGIPYPFANGSNTPYRPASGKSGMRPDDD